MPKSGSASWPDVKTLAEQYDLLLIDLDGTVFRGRQPTDGAVESLDKVRSRKLFITNNASRGADEVATHLRDLGFAATGDDVVTSGQTAAHVLANQLPPGSRVLVVGTDSLANEIAAVGLRPVRLWQDEPVAVVQGHSATTGWPDLAEAALAIRAGALWVAANVDRTLPSERGLLPGNGSMVAALRAATDVEPQVAGKPAPTLMTDAVARGDFHAPLVVGDRLDTDIAGANAAKLPSLMVLTGVNSARDAVYAVPSQRPTYIAHDLRSLHRDAEELAVAPQSAWRVETGDGTVMVSANDDDSAGDGLSVVRAVAWAVWDAGCDGDDVTIEAGDEQARDALSRWSLLTDEDRLA
jgi:glycerol 3-phosphatase-2